MDNEIRIINGIVFDPTNKIELDEWVFNNPDSKYESDEKDEELQQKRRSN